jgi:type I restriction enzyme S subunit
MEVKAGYKQTDVGVIPEDWDVKLLPEVCRFRSGKAHEQHISELGQFICVNSKFISTDGNVRKYCTANFCPAKKDDVLMVMSDLPNGRALAKAFLVDQDDLFAVNQRVCALTAYRDCPRFLFHILNRNPYFLKFDDGVSQTHLLNHVFLKCPLPIPPTLAEQEAIAAVLSDVDALINSLDRLIAKKRDMKRAAMQELLTGKRRLPGFEGEWKMKKVREFGEVITGSTPPTQIKEYWNGSIPWVTPTDISDKKDISNTEREITPMGLTVVRKLPRDTVLVTCIASIGKNAVLRKQGACNQQINAIVPAKECDADFLYYLIENNKRYLLANAGITATNIISKKDFCEITFMLPAIRDEQTAIATVLSDMDTEIVALEKRRDKTIALKQGMMQELLTGRTRLV